MTALAFGLNTRDSQILELLDGGASPTRVTRVGAHRGTWTSEDVQRVAYVRAIRAGRRPEQIPPPPPTPEPVPEPLTVTLAADDPADMGRTVELSDAQIGVLGALCRGLDNAAIGAALHISPDTVKSHLRPIFTALGARDRTHAVVLVLTRQVVVRSGKAA